MNVRFVIYERPFTMIALINELSLSVNTFFSVHHTEAYFYVVRCGHTCLSEPDEKNRKESVYIYELIISRAWDYWVSACLF